MPTVPLQALLVPAPQQRHLPFVDARQGRTQFVRPELRVASGEDKDQADPVTERLRAAEAEAAALRKQLAAAKEARGLLANILGRHTAQYWTMSEFLGRQAVRSNESARRFSDKSYEDPTSSSQEEAPKRRPSRIDGSGLQRETPFAQGPGQWLSEANFLKGVGGPGEAVDAVTKNPEEAATVKRRLIIGGVATAAIAAVALLPTDALRLSRPSKPQFFYLVPLVRVQTLLRELEQAAVDGKPEDVEAGIQRIQGAPNFAVENLRNAAAALPNSTSAEKARVVARDVIEYLDSIDYNKYYESLQRPSARTGEQQKLFLDFSLNSIRAAQGKLKTFLALMPTDQLEAAIQQANPTYDE